MRYLNYLTISFAFLLNMEINAQRLAIPKCLKRNTYIDLSISGGSNQFSGALAAVHFYGLGKNKKFKIGYGFRYTGYSGKDRNFITAPAKLTSGQTGPQVLFSEINPNNYDTVRFSKSQINSINASINLQYLISKKIELGFNIDAIGFSFGKKETGVFSSSQRPSNMAQLQEAKPTSFNLLLISDNDKGTLNSEFYARYWLNNKIAVKGGISFLFSEYTTINKLVLDNDRWRNKSLMAMVGLVINPFKN